MYSRQRKLSRRLKLKWVNRNSEPSSFKTCIYLGLIMLFISHGQHDPPPPPPPPGRDKRWSRTHSACEKSVRFLINTDHLFIVGHLTLLIPKPKCEPSRRFVAYYRCILLPNVLGIYRRGQAVVCANCLNFRRDLPTTRNLLSSELWETTRRRLSSANYRCMHLNECTSCWFTSFSYRPLNTSQIRLNNKGLNHYNKESRCYYTSPWRTNLPDQRYKHTALPMTL